MAAQPCQEKLYEILFDYGYIALIGSSDSVGFMQAQSRRQSAR